MINDSSLGEIAQVSNAKQSNEADEQLANLFCSGDIYVYLGNISRFDTKTGN